MKNFSIFLLSLGFFFFMSNCKSEEDYAPSILDVTPDTLTFSADRITQESISLTWKVVKGAEQYLLFRIEGHGKNPNINIVYPPRRGDVVQYTDINLKPGTEYSYYLKATDVAGNRSKSSNVIRIKTQGKTPETTTPHPDGNPTGTQPTSTGTQPTSTGTQPTSTGTQPTSTGTQPTSTGTQPTSTGTQPTSTGTQPTSTGTQPIPDTNNNNSEEKVTPELPELPSPGLPMFEDVGPTSLTVKWQAPTLPTGLAFKAYKVYRDGELISTINNINENSILDKGLVDKRTYTYVLAILDEANREKKSDEAQVTTSSGIYEFDPNTSDINLTVPTGYKYIIRKAGTQSLFNTKLESIEVPSTVEAIGEDVFAGCSDLSNIRFSKGLKTIGARAFYQCVGLTSVTIPSGVVYLGESAFARCTSLASVSIPSGVTAVEPQTFSQCTRLNSVSLPNTLLEIKEYAFPQCISLSSIVIPASVLRIGSYAFTGCTSLVSVRFSEGLRDINSSAFFECTALTSIEIPASVRAIGEQAFYNCTALSSIQVKSASEPFTTIGTYALMGTSSYLRITVPAGSGYAYRASADWSEYSEKISE